MKIVPNWFKRELKILDPKYYVVYNDHYNYFEIKHTVRIIRHGREFISRPNLAVFKVLNDAAMTNLRKRKYVGRKFQGDTKKYLNWIRRNNEEAKEKKRQIGLEMMTEGYMRIHNLGRRTYFT